VGKNIKKIIAGNGTDKLRFNGFLSIVRRSPKGLLEGSLSVPLERKPCVGIEC